MLIIKLRGGLGNQMFQYAMGQSLKRAGYSGSIRYDTSSYYSDIAHTGYSLEKYFGIYAELASAEEVKALCPYGVYTRRYAEASKLYRKFFRLHSRLLQAGDVIRGKHPSHMASDGGCYLYNDSLFHMDPEQDLYLEGYFQNMAYYPGMQDQLRKTFRFSRPLPEQDQLLAEEMRQVDSVAMHVRRGDYSGTGYDQCGLSYFQKAVEGLGGTENKMFYIFTDDAEYVKAHFGFLEHYKICAHSPEDCDFDLNLMTRCKYHIISNSSFSFWGAYLSRTTQSVYAPEYWFHDGHCLHRFNLPAEWHAVDNRQR